MTGMPGKVSVKSCTGVAVGGTGVGRTVGVADGGAARVGAEVGLAGGTGVADGVLGCVAPVPLDRTVAEAIGSVGEAGPEDDAVSVGKGVAAGLGNGVGLGEPSGA